MCSRPMTEAVSLGEVLQKAISHHQAGELQQAEALYRSILSALPNHADANHNLGTLARQVGKDLDALPFYKAAFEANPAFDQYAKSYANALLLAGGDGQALTSLFSAGKYLDAEHLARSLIQHKQDAGVAWKVLGLVLHLQDKGGIEELSRAAELLPADPACYANLGAAFMRRDQHLQAINAYETAISLKPDFALAHLNLGLGLMAMKRHDKAAEHFQRVVSLDPGAAEAHNHLGAAMKEMGRHEEALPHFARSIELDPSDAEPHCNMGVALTELKRFDDAMASLKRAIECQPGHAVAHHALGIAWIELGQMTLALEAIQNAVRLAPDWVEARYNLATVLRDLRRLAEAETVYRQALALQPDQDYLFGSWLYTRLNMCQWDELGQYVGELEAKVSEGKKTITPFASLPLSNSRKLHARAAAMSAPAEPEGNLGLPKIVGRQEHGKIRIAYFSADFHEHATAYLMAELFERHDRSRFELYAYSFGPTTRDPMQLRVMAAFDHFIEVQHLSDRDVAMLARQHGIDIAVDLKGYTHRCRTAIFAWRAAPLQVNFIGYPGTMGAPYMDYIVADPILIPEEHRGDYSEKIVYLPNSYQVNDRQRRVSEKPFTRAQMGLPERAFVFCCFNNNFKIQPATFDAWMRILCSVDGSVLWLFEDNPEAASNLRKEAKRRGVGADRLVFAQRMEASEHLARQRLADLFLDTLPYNAHTTASDALWVGLPVLTLLGDTFAGRVAASLLNAIRLPELITTTAAEFEEKAVALAHNGPALAAIKGKLAANRLTTPLFDAALFARHIEAAYQRMLERHQAGLALDHLYISGE